MRKFINHKTIQFVSSLQLFREKHIALNYGKRLLLGGRMGNINGILIQKEGNIGRFYNQTVQKPLESKENSLATENSLKFIKIETIESVQKVVEEMAAKIGVESKLLPHFRIGKLTEVDKIEEGRTVEEESGLFHYSHCKNGKKIVLFSTSEVNELLYFIFKDITFEMAREFEKQQCETRNFKILFEKQIELMETLEDQWKERISYEIDCMKKELEIDYSSGNTLKPKISVFLYFSMLLFIMILPFLVPLFGWLLDF